MASWTRVSVCWVCGVKLECQFAGYVKLNSSVSLLGM